jgi:hypothetical protein
MDRSAFNSDEFILVPRKVTEDMILAGMGSALGISFEAGGVREDVIEINRRMIEEAETGQKYK